MVDVINIYFDRAHLNLREFYISDLLCFFQQNSFYTILCDFSYGVEPNPDIQLLVGYPFHNIV